jgi:HK97 family phage major capsid protein
MTAKELREKRATVSARIAELSKKVSTEARDFTADEQTQWDAANKDYDQLTRQIAIAERAEAIDTEQRSQRVSDEQLPGREDTDEHRSGRSEDWGEASGEATHLRGGTPEQQRAAFRAWARKGRRLGKGDSEALRATGIDPSAELIEFRGSTAQELRQRLQSRAMSAINDAAGASTVAQGFVQNFEQALLAYGGILNVAEILRTDTGAELPWPTTNDTTNEGEIIGENTTASDQDVATGSVKFGAHIFSSKVIKIPNALLQDSAFDLAGEVGRMIGVRIGRKTNSSMTTGTGIGAPRGIVTAATLGVTTAGATAITYDELVNLVFSIDPAYLAQPGCGFMFHANVLAYIAKIKDGNARPIWDSSVNTFNRLGTNVSVGQMTLAGLSFPFVINQSMASTVAATNKTVVFGALNKYKVRQVQTLRVRRLVERYAELDQEGFVGFLRQDGNLLDAGTNPVKYIAQHA